MSIAMMLMQLVGSFSMDSCGLMTHGGVLACACIMAVLHIVIFADRVVGMMASCIRMLIWLLARVLLVDGVFADALVAKISIIMHVLGTAFVLNVCAAMICTMARFLHNPKAWNGLHINRRRLGRTS